jgi:hypothetical protein
MMHGVNTRRDGLLLLSSALPTHQIGAAGTAP